MRKRHLFPLLLLLLLACQKDNGIQHSVVSPNVDVQDFNSPDEVFSFLSQEMPERFNSQEIARLQSMLSSEPEKSHKRSSTVELPAGSTDALEAAVNDAGPGGTVIVKAGEHTENGLVTIGHQVHIVGEDGAVIKFGNPVITDFPAQLSGGIRILNAPRTTVTNIDFLPSGDNAGVGIVVENSDRVQIRNNSFTNFQFGIQVVSGDFNTVAGNEITGDLSLLSFTTAHGIIFMNGKHGCVVDNDISGFVFGIWACDKGGLSWGNTTQSCLYGQILCKVPQGDIVNPEGEDVYARDPANHWLVAMNSASNNFYAGYVAIDGANKNVLLANEASNNAVYDIDLVGPTERFGFFAPTSSKNRVYAYSGQSVKDCGEKNKVTGGDAVDITMHPCDNVDTP